MAVLIVGVVEGGQENEVGVEREVECILTCFVALDRQVAGRIVSVFAAASSGEEGLLEGEHQQILVRRRPALKFVDGAEPYGLVCVVMLLLCSPSYESS